ncbi:ABC transporter substrate-binding protein [Actinomadura sp. 21ATH]|uniref:ABC transporter substrate-binding protein n=1 Tax=Actinomadura sp. 21ATH TaxID=1735444 RepID=UPI0035C0E282
MRKSSIRRAAAGIAAAALTTLGLAACGSSDGGGSGTPIRTVQHAMGTTKIFKEPKRIVALDQTFVDTAVTLDADVHGFTTFTANEQKLPGYLSRAAGGKHTAGARTVGTLSEPSLEKISALKPDLILSAKIRHEALYGKLSQIAPTVFSETTGATWKENLRLTAKALGKDGLAEQRIKEFETRARTIGDAVRKKNDGKMPAVSVVRFTDEPTVRLYTENSYVGIILKDAGFPRPPGQPTSDKIAVDLSEERIKDLDADEIFLARYADESGKSSQVQTKFKNNPLWGRLAGTKREVSDETWMLAVGLQGAHLVLDDLAKFHEVDAARTA